MVGDKKGTAWDIQVYISHYFWMESISSAINTIMTSIQYVHKETGSFHWMKYHLKHRQSQHSTFHCQLHKRLLAGENIVGNIVLNQCYIYIQWKYIIMQRTAVTSPYIIFLIIPFLAYACCWFLADKFSFINKKISADLGNVTSLKNSLFA